MDDTLARTEDCMPLEAHIAASWQRCRGLGLERGFDPQPNAVTRFELQRLLERDMLLAEVAAPELEALTLAMADTGHGVLLFDDAGRVVSVGGDTRYPGVVLRYAHSGVECSELQFGTTAPATALLERRPVLVRGGEHFLRNLRHMECLAVPIFRPGGELIGVINVASEARPLAPGVPDLIHGSVARIERLLLRHLRSPSILRLHPHPGCLGTPLEGLVALGADGEVLGLNSAAARLIGVDHLRAVGCGLGELLGADLRQLGRAGDGLLRLRSPGGIGLCATLAEAPDLDGRQRAQRPPAAAAPRQPVAAPMPMPMPMPMVEKLTARELKILRQLDSGLGNRDIARSLFISEGTLKWHLHNIYGKLGSRSRTAALARARALGLLDLSPAGS
jgi:sigma-54 dependent transcriptional regulator, acetoin dehydrogenase operon transcriptional activator AcoR